MWFLKHPAEAQELAVLGRELVRQRFLFTRLIDDELQLYASLLCSKLRIEPPVSQIRPVGEERDPVCGMRIRPHNALPRAYTGRMFAFCTGSCRQQFETTPLRLLRSQPVTHV